MLDKPEPTGIALGLADSLFEHSPTGIILTDAEQTILRVNPAFTAISGYSAENAIGKTPWTLSTWHHDQPSYEALVAGLHFRGAYQAEVCNRRRDGSFYPAWLNIAAIYNEQHRVVRYVTFLADLSAHKKAQQLLETAATHDPLTGLPGRTLLMDRLEHAQQRTQRSHRRMAILYVNLDRFRKINDSLNHIAGDTLLQAVSARLLNCVRAEDTLARLGGDEFLLLLEGLSGSYEAGMVARKLLAALNTPFDIQGHEVFVKASIGISLYPDHTSEAAALVTNASIAMYRAKEAGGGNFQFYNSALNPGAFERLVLESDMHKAIERGDFQLQFQPQISLRTHAIVGVEALIRWRHSERGLVYPDKFIALAEETGLIRNIDEWVLWTACRQMKAWRLQGLPPLRIAVNLSASRFVAPDLVDMVAAVLRDTGLEPDALELEITESILMKDLEGSARIMRALKEKGVHLAIDDFGTGYSSLSYLKYLPLDRLKIDMSFVHGIQDHASDRAIARAVVVLGHSLAMAVVAEGVETEAQRKILWGYGCEEAQGYLFGRPMDPEALVAQFHNAIGK